MWTPKSGSTSWLLQNSSAQPVSKMKAGKKYTIKVTVAPSYTNSQYDMFVMTDAQYAATSTPLQFTLQIQATTDPAGSILANFTADAAWVGTKMRFVFADRVKAGSDPLNAVAFGSPSSYSTTK